MCLIIYDREINVLPRVSVSLEDGKNMLAAVINSRIPELIFVAVRQLNITSSFYSVEQF